MIQHARGDILAADVSCFYFEKEAFVLNNSSYGSKRCFGFPFRRIYMMIKKTKGSPILRFLP